MSPSPDHFKGKSVVEHLREARNKGAAVAQEVHGAEMPGHLAAAADAAKETAITFFVIGFSLLLFGLSSSSTEKLLWVFLFAWIVWKTGRSALLGWTRLERLHRLIEEERYEIQHNRAQEKEELTELYEAKGFSGKMLEQVVEVLMADDNRLLKVMLEEELGLTLESYEHPLKQATGAALGVFIAAILSLIGFHYLGMTGLILGSLISLCVATLLTSKIERNRTLNALMWTFAIAILSGGVAYFAYVLIFKK